MSTCVRARAGVRVASGLGSRVRVGGRVDGEGEVRVRVRVRGITSLPLLRLDVVQPDVVPAR